MKLRKLPEDSVLMTVKGAIDFKNKITLAKRSVDFVFIDGRGQERILYPFHRSLSIQSKDLSSYNSFMSTTVISSFNGKKYARPVIDALRFDRTVKDFPSPEWLDWQNKICEKRILESANAVIDNAPLMLKDGPEKWGFEEIK